MEKRLNPEHNTGLETGSGLQWKAWRPSPAEEASRGVGAGCVPDALAVWSPRGGHACGGGVAWLVRVLRRTSCPEKGGVSTAGAAAMHLKRWRR
jgi:hypothetical protein